MALTLDRPKYTAAELNFFYNWLKSEIAAKGPSQYVSARPGITAIADLDLSDSYGASPITRMAKYVLTPSDLIGVLVRQANYRSDGARWMSNITTTTDDVPTKIRLSIYTPGQTYIQTPQVITRGRNAGDYDADVNTIRTATRPSLSFQIDLHVPATGLTNYSIGSGINTMATMIGLVEPFTDFIYTPFSTVVGQHETFDSWPMGRKFTQPTEAYQMLYTSTTISAASLAAQITGSNTTFTVPTHVSGSLRVYWNGVRQTVGTEVIDNGTSITTTFTAQAGDALIIDYQPV